MAGPYPGKIEIKNDAYYRSETEQRQVIRKSRYYCLRYVAAGDTDIGCYWNKFYRDILEKKCELNQFNAMRKIVYNNETA